MTKEQEMEIWLRAYLAYIASGHGYSDVESITRSAKLVADECLTDYRIKFNL